MSRPRGEDKYLQTGTPPFTHYFTNYCRECHPGREKVKIYDCRVRCIGRSEKERCGYPLRESDGVSLITGKCKECLQERNRHREIDLHGALRLMAAVVIQARHECHLNDSHGQTARMLLASAKDSDTIVGAFISYAAYREGLSP